MRRRLTSTRPPVALTTGRAYLRALKPKGRVSTPTVILARLPAKGKAEMTCHSCRIDCRKFGKRGNRQRFQCAQCHRVFTEPREDHLHGMYLPIETAELVLRLLLEGNSVSSVERLNEVHHSTILKLLVIAGEKCERIMGEKVRNVPVRDVDVDELWALIYKKQKRVRPEDDPNLGDAYTFVAIERHTKLVLNFALGKRDQATTDIFIEGLRQATASSPFQITPDGLATYRSAITTTLSDRVDFAQLIKVYPPPRKAKPGTRLPRLPQWR